MNFGNSSQDDNSQSYCSDSSLEDSGYEFELDFLEDPPREDKINNKVDQPAIISEGKTEELPQEDNILATLLQLEEDEKLAKKLFAAERQFTLNKIEQTTYIGNTKLSETYVKNPLKPAK